MLPDRRPPPSRAAAGAGSGSISTMVPIGEAGASQAVSASGLALPLGVLPAIHPLAEPRYVVDQFRKLAATDPLRERP